VYFVHGSPRVPTKEYMVPTDIRNREKMTEIFSMIPSLCFVGHSHIPLTVMRFSDDPGRTAYTLDTEVDLSETIKALINVGSVGQPRDENPLTAYVLFDTERRHSSLLRIPYDVEAEVARIAEAGLPRVLGERLRIGV